MRYAGEGGLYDPHRIRLRRGPQVAGGIGNGRYSALRPASARRGMYGIAGIYACFRHEESLCHHDRLRTGGFGGQFHEARCSGLYPQKTVAGKTDADDKGTGSKVKNQTHRPHIRAQKCDLSGNKPTYRAGSSDRHGCADTG